MSSRSKYSPSLFDTEDGECYKCHAVCDTARHEVYYGRGVRSQSKEHGMWVCLCPRCHALVHQMPNMGFDEELKAEGRTLYLKSHTEQEFISRFITGNVKGWE